MKKEYLNSFEKGGHTYMTVQEFVSNHNKDISVNVLKDTAEKVQSPKYLVYRSGKQNFYDLEVLKKLSKSYLSITEI